MNNRNLPTATIRILPFEPKKCDVCNALADELVEHPSGVKMGKCKEHSKQWYAALERLKKGTMDDK